MFSAMLLVISILALSQFALYYWRSIVSGIAAQPVSGRVLEAAHVTGGSVTAEDFDTFAGLHDLTPDLQANARSLTTVRLYVRVVEGLSAQINVLRQTGQPAGYKPQAVDVGVTYSLRMPRY